MKINWKDQIEESALEKGDKIISCTLSEDEAKVEFDGDYGGARGKPFTAWGEKYVYFPICYDGAEWVGHAPRFPDNLEVMVHQGG